MTAAPLPVRAGVAEQLARLAHYCSLEHHDDLVPVAYFLIGDVGGVGPAGELWEKLQEDCLALWPLVSDDWCDRDLIYDPALTEDERFDRTYADLTTSIEHAVRLARYQAVEGRRLAAYRAHRADTDRRCHPGLPGYVPLDDLGAL